MGYLSLPSPVEFQVYDAQSEELEGVLEMVEQGKWMCVCDPVIWQQSSRIKTEHHYLLVFDRFLALNGVRKYTNQTIESCSLSFELLEKIAVQTAKLEPTGSIRGWRQ